MRSIFEYYNYRLYLREYYEERKATTGFTYREFSNLTGMNSTSWLLHLIKGTKNLSRETSHRIAKALKMAKPEAEYFELLVAFTQAKTNAIKDEFYQKMLGLKRKLKVVHLEAEQYEYYAKWYHPVVRSLVTKVDFAAGRSEPDFAKLAACLIPPISEAEARNSVQLLEKLGLIQRDIEGRYAHKEALLTTGDEVASLHIVNYHKQVWGLADEAHDRIPRAERDITALTLGVGEEEFLAIKGKIQAFRKEIMAMAQASRDADRVYQLNFQLFPVGKRQP